MTKTENTVTYGLKNVHIAPIESINSETKVISYGQNFPFPWSYELGVRAKRRIESNPSRRRGLPLHELK